MGLVVTFGEGEERLGEPVAWSKCSSRLLLVVENIFASAAKIVMMMMMTGQWQWQSILATTANFRMNSGINYTLLRLLAVHLLQHLKE